MYYRIGLDIGITSVGWAVIEDDEHGKPIRIVDLGSRIFEAAEIPKTGEALSAARRNARGARRINRRKIHRIKRVKDLLVKQELITKQEIENIYTPDKFSYNIYELRVAGLDRKLNSKELARVLINLVKKRGYKSNSKAEESVANSDQGKAKVAITDNRELMKSKQYRTVAEMYLKDPKFKLTLENGEKVCDSAGRPILKIRNTTNDYKTTVERSLLLEEAELILKSQQKYNEKITDEFVQAYINIFSSQRNYDEGPAFPSKYGGNLIENMLGNCTFEENEKRAPKATYTFEKFKLLQDFNSIKLQKLNLRTSSKGNIYHEINEVRPLSFEEKTILLEKFKITDSLSYDKIRKLLSIPYDTVFNSIDYDFRNLNEKTIQQSIDENEKNSKKKLLEFQSFHVLRKALDKYEKGYIANLAEQDIDSIATILTLYKSDEKRKEYLINRNINVKIIPYLLPLSFSKFGHLSIKAMNKIIPYLAEGLTYDKAVNMVYEDFRGRVNKEKKTKLSLNDIEQITNPVVRRAVSQTVKVVNAIVSKYGKPDLVNVELAREISKNFSDRKKLEKQMLDNLSVNESVINEIKGKNLKDFVTGQDIVKFKLWKSQDGICPYSGQKIAIESLFTKDVDVDHIIPYSKCFDDSYNNKVLVKASENRMKSNRTPLEYLSQSNKDIDEYIVRIENMYSNNSIKRKRLLKEHFTEEDEATWKDRNLKDTQYISKVVLALIRNNLEFRECEEIAQNKRAMAVKGKITEQIRKRLNFEKVRDGDKHHAMDAAIIAITTESMIRKITLYEKNKETRYTEDSIEKEKYYENFPTPYEKFEKELKARLLSNDEQVKAALEKLNIIEYKLNGYPKSIFVSKMPKRKVRGSAHKETIKGLSKNGNFVSKTDLCNLKLTKDNEIEGYYNKQDDKLLYEALRQRLIKYDNNAKEAFKEPFFKPKSDGTKGPLVKKVKIESVTSSNLYLEKMHGAAGNGDMIRIDVFYVKNDGYYLVPIYVADTIKDKLPNKACMAAKRQTDWKEMKDDDFIFSLYPGDLIYIKNKREIKLKPLKKDSNRENMSVNEIMGYYVSTGISNASITITNHDRTYVQESLGIKTLEEIKKYQVDVLGNYTEVRLPEKRMKFNFKRK